MTYGFKFYNNSNNLVIDDTQIKPWYITDAQIGLNYNNINVTNQFTEIAHNQPKLDAGYTSPAETWDVFELRYYAPTGQACFVVYTLPEASSSHVWYSTKTGPYSLTQSTGQGIAEYENGRPIFSIYAMVPKSWGATANTSQINAAIPKVYFYAAGNPTPVSSGYGIQVYNPYGQCTYSSEYKHIKLETYSFKSPQLPIIDPNLVGPYYASAYVNEISINSSTPDTAGFLIPRTIFDRYEYNSSTGIAKLFGSRVFFQRQGNTLRSRNIDTDYYGNVNASTYGITTSTYLTKGLKVVGNTNSTGAGLNTYFADILIVDTAPLDRNYQNQPLPATYTLQLGNTDDIYEYEPSAASIPMYNQSIYLYVTGITNGTTVSFVISGTNITAEDFSAMADGGRGGNGVSQNFTPALNGYITVYNGTAIFNFSVANDNILEGTETFVFKVYDANSVEKTSISVNIKEFKTYSLAWYSPDTSGAYNEGITAVARLTTRNVANGTAIPFEIIAKPGSESALIDVADITGFTYLTGNFTVSTSGTSSTGTADLTMVIAADQKTEGDEFFRITIPSVSTIYLDGKINDTSLTPVYTYSITRASQQIGDIYVDEGSSVVFYITSNAPNGTVVYPVLVAPNTASFADIAVSEGTTPDSTKNFFPIVNGVRVNTGITINYGIAAFTVLMVADNIFEGTEYFSVALDKPAGTRVADYKNQAGGNAKVYINDTSNGATYYLDNQASEVYSEGQWIDIAMHANNNYGTTMYWTLEGTGIDTNDIQYMRYHNPNIYGTDYGQGLSEYESITVSLEGTFTFPPSLEKHLQFFIKNDAITEGEETAVFKLKIGGSTGTTKATMNIVITDTSRAPVATYAISNNISYPYTVNEGDTITWTVTTTNVSNYTTLTFNSSGVNQADFNDSWGNYTYGNITIVNNTATFNRTIKQDYVTEGQETLTMTICQNNSGLLTVLATDPHDIYITDSSITPNESITVNTSTPTIGSNVTVSGSGAKPGDTVGYSIDSTSYTDGNITVASDGTWSIQVAAGTSIVSKTFYAKFAFTQHTRSVNWQTHSADPTFTITTIVQDNPSPVPTGPGSYSYAYGNEGQTVYFWISSTNAANTTINYSYPFLAYGSTYNFVDGDITGSSLAGGTITLNSSGNAYVTANIVANQRTEGANPRYLYLKVNDTANLAYTYGVALIYDTSQTSVATYAISNNISYPYSVNEGGTITWTVTTTNVPNYTVLRFNSSGLNQADFDDSWGNYTYGDVTIINNTATFSRTIKQDYVTEGQETLTMTICQNNSGLLSILATDPHDIYINDTSQTPVTPVYNETVTISPTTSDISRQFLTFQISGGKPDSTFRFKVLPYGSAEPSYGAYETDTAFVINGFVQDSNGNVTYNGGSGTWTNYRATAPTTSGSYTAWVYFNGTTHVKSVDFTRTDSTAPVALSYTNRTFSNSGITTGYATAASSYSTSSDSLTVGGNNVDSSDNYATITFIVNKACTLTWTMAALSEGNYDFGYFYVDNNIQQNYYGITSISGNSSINGSTSLAAGSHTIKLLYHKDDSVSRLSDNVTATWSVS